MQGSVYCHSSCSFCLLLFVVVVGGGAGGVGDGVGVGDSLTSHQTCKGYLLNNLTGCHTKLQIKVVTSFGHRLQTPGQPVPALPHESLVSG